MLAIILVLVSVFPVAWWLTGRVRKYAVTQDLLDVPNRRSSHVVPTPRGGGAAIVLSTMAALPIFGALGVLPWPDVAGLIGAGVMVALIGFIDDHGHVPPHWRLLGHFVAAAWMLAWLGGMPPFTVFGAVLHPGWIGQLLTTVYAVWLVNLTNFMDGIDGIAGVEAITAGLGGAVLYAAGLPGTTLWPVPLVVASATLGFLVWNWPPAKIFMGDTGSGFLGLLFAALSIQAASAAPQLFFGWLILLGVFVSDATFTLLRRLTRRERVHEAHRSHAYQHAARRYASHEPVAIAVALINVGWLLPIALLVTVAALDPVTGVAVAYTPLFIAAWSLGAGKAHTATI